MRSTRHWCWSLPLAALLALATLSPGSARAQLAQRHADRSHERASAAALHAGHDHDHGELDHLLNMHDQEIHFTQNQGQFGREVLFRADFPLGQAVATRQGMVITAFDPAAVEERMAEGFRIEEEMSQGRPYRPLKWQMKGHSWRLDFEGASPEVRVEGRESHEEVRHYFLGDAVQHATDVTSFQEVWYRDVYPGIDARYYPAEDGSLEYDVICRAGSSPDKIAIRFAGVDRMRVDEKGQLVLSTSLGELAYPAPYVYQRVNGRETEVKSRYIVEDGNLLRFDLGDYNTAEPLIIDPIAMRWATWVNTNSSGDNHGHCIWVDPTDGAIYIVARVVGTTDQITPGAFDTSANGNLETIVGKYLEPATVGGSGTRVWQTYIGGSGDDNPYAMEQGKDGNLYIAGYTSSTNFPTLGGTAFTGTSLNQQAQSGNDVFVLKITTDGSSIKAATIGGNGADEPYDLRIAKNGDVLVCGITTSTNLLTVNAGSGAVNSNTGGEDILMFRLDQDLSTLGWMRNFGGSSDDRGNIMLVDPVTDDIFLAGRTASTNFPILAARQSTRGGSAAGFVQRFTGAGNTTWSSYFSSASTKQAAILCMAFNTTRTELYFGGFTSGLDAANISASAVYDNSYNGGNNDFFVGRMGIDQTFIGSTYVGGSLDEVNMMGLNLDENNDVYVFGYTNSTNFPISSAPNVPLQATNQGGNDKVFFKLESDLSALEFSTYYGGTSDDYDPVGQRGIKFNNCRIYTIVTSRSNNIPLTQGALNTSKLSTTSRYEPGLVVWANPPDLLENSITGNQSVCAGSVPTDIVGSTPSYTLPTIVRNNAASAYPSLGNAATFQWQMSTDSVNWADIAGAVSQNLAGSFLGPIGEKTFVRRIIGGDACVLAGAADQVVSVKVVSVSGTVNNLSCNGANDGSITATSDGVAPFSYLWSNGAQTATINGLAPGTYGVTVTDMTGCSAEGSFTVTQPAVLSASTVSTSATCNTSNGSAVASATGGTAPYTYVWDNNTNGSQLNGVEGGSYTVTVTDAKGCTATATATVGSTGVPNISVGAAGVITCSTNQQLVLNGGSTTSGVSFSWSASNGGNIVSGGNSASPTVNAAGTYTLTVTAPNLCFATESTTVTLDVTAPGASASVSGVLSCNVSEVTLSATGNGSFAWSGPNGYASSEQNPTVSAAGTYTLVVTGANGCTSQDSTEVSMDDVQPLASAQGGVLSCNVSEVTLTGTGIGSFAWSGPNGYASTEQNPIVIVAGTYTLSVTGANGCVGTDSTEVTLDNVQPMASAQGGVLNCTVSEVTLTGSGIGSYAWSGPNGFASNDQNPTVSVAGTYTLVVTGANGCTDEATAEVTLDNVLPGATAEGGVLNCNVSSVTLSATGNGSFAWSGPNGFASNDQNPSVSAAGTYTVVVTGANGCTSEATAEVSSDDTLPGASAQGGVLNCNVSSVTLSATGNGSFAWSGPNGFASNDQNPSVSAAGTYTVVVTGANGCTSSATAEVSNDDTLPGATAIGGVLDCNVSSLMLMATGNGSFAWSGPNGFTSNDPNPSVSAAGTYTLVVTGENGCTSQDSAEVTLDNVQPIASAQGGVLNCNVSEVTLAGSGIGSFAWSGPNSYVSNDQNPSVSVAGIYTLVVTGANGCTDEASAEVTLDNALPGATAEGGVLNCNVSSVTLSATGNGSFSWSGPNGFASNDQNPSVSAAGTYTVVVTSANGCTSEATAEVSSDDVLPGATAEGGVLNCNVSSVTLTATGNGSFAWSGPNGFASNDQNPSVSAAGTYTVVVTGPNGCTSQATAEVSSDDTLPGASAQGGVLNCNVSSVTLTASGNGSFAWSGPNGFTSNDQNPSVSAAGTYTVVVTGANGCTSEATAEVSSDDVLPGASAQGGVLNCNVSSVTLSATGNGSFAWSGPNGFASNDQNPSVSAAGTYTVVVTGANGCTSEATAEVTLNDELPGATATGGVLNCNVSSVMLTATGSGNFSWSGPNGFASNDQNPSVSAAGTYTVVVTGANGCTSQATAEVSSDDTLPGASAQGGVLNCNVSSVTLSATGNGSFAWSGPNGFASNDQNPSVSAAGTYTVVVTGANGCTSQATAEVSSDDTLPGASAQGGVLNCNVSSVTLSATGNGSFAWSGPNGFASNDQNPSVSAAGTYTVVVTGTNGCSSEATAEVSSDDTLPGATATGGVLNCNVSSVTLTATGNGSFAWSGPNGFASNDQSPSVSAAGTYTVVVTGANGCTSQATAEVSSDDTLPGASAQGGVLNCNVSSVTLTATGNGSFAWSGPNGFASNEQNPSVSAAGTYTVVVTGANGCTSEATAEVSSDDTLPDATATGGVLNCNVSSVTLSATGNGSFAWSGPNGFASNDQNPSVSAAGTYTVVVTGANGCTSQATAEVSSDISLPGATAMGGALDCATNSVTLSATGNGSFAWSGPNGFVSNEQNPTVTAAGTYTLVVSGSNGCTSTATANVVDGDCDKCPPMIISCGPDVTIECGTSDHPLSVGAPIFRKDESCPEVSVGWTDEWFGTCPYTLVRTWTATDATGAVEICIQTITVVDTNPPVLMNVPENVTVSCSGVPEADDLVWGADDCKKTYPVMVNDIMHASDCANSYVIERIYSSTDDCGNTGTATQWISVVDMDAPVFGGVPADITVSCDAVPAPAEVSVFDMCDPNVSVELEETIFPGTCAGDYKILRVWTATDACGNTAYAGQLVTVVDNEAPVWTCIPKPVTVDCNSIPGTIECTPTDNCGGDVTVDMTEVKTGGGCKGNYTITRTYTAVDECGNASSFDQVINVHNGPTFTSASQANGQQMRVSAAPNPFRSESAILFEAVEDGHTVVEVMDMQGRRVAQLFNADVKAGQEVRVTFRPVENGSGVFIYRISQNGQEMRGRLLYQP